MFKKIEIEENIEVRTLVSLRIKLNKIINSFDFIELNFEKVTYVDSSGISFLMNLANRMKLRNGILLLSNVRKPLLDLFQITDLHRVARIVEIGDYEGNLSDM